MDYRLDKHLLLDILGQWNGFAKRKIHLIACGGTAMTLQDIKESTKDVDFIVPVDLEHLDRHFREMAQYDISETRILGNLDRFLDLLRGERP